MFKVESWKIFKGRFMKGLTFLSKMIHEMIGVWTLSWFMPPNPKRLTAIKHAKSSFRAED